MLRLFLGVPLGAALLLALAVGGVAGRLAQGPLDVTALARIAAVGAAPGMQIDRVTVALQGSALRIVASGLHAPADGPQVAEAALVLDGAALLHGALRPQDLTMTGLRLHASLAPDGTLSLPGLPQPGGGDMDPAMLRGLAHLGVQDGTVIDDESPEGSITGVTIDLQQDRAGGWTGQARAMLASAALKMNATRTPEGATRLHATTTGLNPAAMVWLDPALAALDAKLDVTADIDLTPALALRHAAVHAEAGPGRAVLPVKGGSSPAAFASVALDAEGNLQSLRLTSLRLVLAPPSGAPPSTVTVSGDASRGAGTMAAHLHVTLDRGQMADLGALWPVGVGGGARPWLVENVTAGAVHDGRFDFVLQGGPALDDIDLTAASGTMQADDVTVWWLRPVPPIEHAHVTLKLLDPDTLTLAATGARQGTLMARQASMRVWGMSTKDQFGQLDGDITAPIADVFTLLRHPTLELLSVHPLPIPNPTGQSVTHLTVKLPLDDKLVFEQVGIHATTRLTDVRIGNLAPGRDLDRGALTGDITQDRLALAGTARLAGIPSSLGVEMDFRDGPPAQIVQHVTLSARADEQALAAAGLDTIGLLAGAVSAKLDYAEQRDGHAVLQGTADLGEASLSTPLGWSKPAGPAASVEARAQLDHGHLAGFDRLKAEGPGLSVLGRSEMIDGWPSILHVERGVIGRTNLTGTVTFPARAGDALQVALSGPMLDLSGPLRSQAKTAAAPADPAPGRPYRVDLRFDRVVVGTKGDGLGPVSLAASNDGRRVTEAHFASAGPEGAEARIAPNREGRHVTASVADLGALLRGLDAGTSVDQGALALQGTFDDRLAIPPLTGEASLTRFGIRGATLAGKLLQGATLYGLVDALRGPGLVFDQATVPFVLTGQVLDLLDARAYSASLGVTAQGRVDFGASTLDVQGTIVPAYLFNTLPGRMPLIGRLFSPESGGGLLAATYNLHGPLRDPAVGVNPLAALTPGVLRGLFGLFN